MRWGFWWMRCAYPPYVIRVLAWGGVDAGGLVDALHLSTLRDHVAGRCEFIRPKSMLRANEFAPTKAAQCSEIKVGQTLTRYIMLGIVKFASYAIDYFCEAVKTEVDVWPVGLRARYRALTLRMMEHGPNLGMPHSRAMGDGLFELRAKSAEGIGRAFYCVLVGRRIIILHEFVKKSDKTPPKELKLARNRMKEVLNHA